ncbi:cytochrome P450 [Actinoplanes sp. N902-109]|uniref:cytochrome P450 n=1 Tax=Actinoplanes sp. (strain N902-109) TaxID=649831 RepID=UPI00032954CF|nr:cytochrome P450 [Actinoplanes sp. N902-109]AGL19002.1 Cytochrome P450 monooxygenase [Actinoplanes sp. N902-109]
MPATVAYDPLDAATIADPLPVYAELRRHGPLHWHEGMNSWVFPRHEDCHRILKDADTYARDVRRVGEDVPRFRQTIQSVDPPGHKRVRTTFVRAFKDQDLGRIADRLRVAIQAVRRRTEPGVEFDYVEQVARPLAIEASSAILGIPTPDGRLVGELSAAIARRMDSGLDPSRRPDGDAARHQLNELVDSFLARGSREGMLSGFADPAGLDHYVTNTIAVIFNASYSTVFASLGTTVDVLLDQPPDAVRDALARDPDRAADELVRFAGPTQGTSRRVTRDTLVHGTLLPRGATVLALVGSANHDEQAFDRPEQLNYDRWPNRHLGFGWGPHSCFGAPLGKLALAVAHTELLHRAQPLTRAGATRWKSSATLRTAEQIPVAFTPTRRGR